MAVRMALTARMVLEAGAGGGGRWAGKDGRPALADTARMRRFMERRLESLVQRLDLNEDQRQSFADLHRQNGRRIIAPARDGRGGS